MYLLSGTETERNLLAAFVGESQSHNRYALYAEVAGKEGFRQIEAIFLQTADHERIHAVRFFRFLGEGRSTLAPTCPFHLGTTAENLRAAAEAEEEEHTRLYRGFAGTAREEGFHDVATLFDLIAGVEARHEERFRALLAHVENGTVFRRAEPVPWVCRKCGFVHEGRFAPRICPACAHLQEYFERYVPGW